MPQAIGYFEIRNKPTDWTPAPEPKVINLSIDSIQMSGSSYVWLTTGKVYSWSAWLKASANTDCLFGVEQGGLKICAVTTEWKKFMNTFTASDFAHPSFVRYEMEGFAGEVEMQAGRIEPGSKLTSWAQAPEEVKPRVFRNMPQKPCRVRGRRIFRLRKAMSDSHMDIDGRYDSLICKLCSSYILRYCQGDGTQGLTKDI